MGLLTLRNMFRPKAGVEPAHSEQTSSVTDPGLPLLQQAESSAPASDQAGSEAGSGTEDTRSEPRTLTGIASRLRLPTSEHDCEIIDLSPGGMRIEAPAAVVNVGQQVVVVMQHFPHLIGVVRWTAGGMMGVQFAKPITPELIEKMGEIKRRVRTERPARFETELPCVIYFDKSQLEVVVNNISVGGMLVTGSLPSGRARSKPVRSGQAIMIAFPDMMPFGGHVRWTRGAQWGVMFSKPLTVAAAEDICRLSNAHYALIHEARLSTPTGY